MANRELTLTVIDERRVRIASLDGSGDFDEQKPDPARLKTIEIFQEWLDGSKISKRKELEVLGTHLYNMIFFGKVELYFFQQLESLHKKERLRLQLNFEEDAYSRQGLPWEYLYSPDSGTRPGFFLATKVELVLSRFMSLSKKREDLPADEGPLRILIVVSQPENLPPVLAEPVIEVVEGLENTKLVCLREPSVGNFLECLQDLKANNNEPHILHFIGHGRFDQADKKGQVAFLLPDRKGAKWVNDIEFTENLSQIDVKPRLVILHLCESGLADFKANFAGIAPKLIRSGVPAVIAMQYPITNQAAIVFSRAFYGELAKGEPIDNAVQTARWQMTNDLPDAYDSRVFGTPVLYMRSYTGIIKPAVESEKAQSVSKTPQSISTPSTAASKSSRGVPLSGLLAQAERDLVSMDLLEQDVPRYKKRISEIRASFRGKPESEYREILEKIRADEQDPYMIDILEEILERLDENA